MLHYIMIALGWILNAFYNIVGNYGIAIILFTVFVKAVLLPLDLKQKRSMAKTQKIQPLLMEVQKKYANDKEKLNQETMKIYQKYGINPMGGCLPMLVQFPVIIALYWVVKKPVMYMMGIGEGDIWRVAEAFNVWAQANMDSLPDALKNIVPVTYEKSMANNTFGTYEISIAQQLFKNPAILEHPFIKNWDKSVNLIDFDFFGIDLSEIPNLSAFFGMFLGNFKSITKDVALLWIIPVLSGVSSFASSKIMSMQQEPEKKKKQKNVVVAEADREENPSSAASTMKTMSIMMPLFSAWFAFTLPAAVGLYWIVSNVIQIVQQVVVTKYLVPDVSVEALEGDITNVKKNRKNRKKRK